MFDSWESSGQFATLFRVDREVRVDVARVFPATATRKDELPLWVRAGGLQLEATMAARQVAWIRTSTGGWVAYVQMPAASGNGRSRLTMDLWVPADALSPGDE
jgi:hypothetical protein